ncbi:MAG TPA: cytochrome c biogenesis protein CcsA [Bacteroidota bacterium]|nr:cytochrome c biogenesis protein CcsA [Bacteroidota bacterium]
MKIVRAAAITLVTLVLVAGIAIPMTASPKGWLEFPTIRGLEQNARNIFFHVPIAWTTLVAFLVSMFYAVRYLQTKRAEYDIRSVASASLGFMFCFLATVTGALWARFNWGSFWNWDPRETSIFILLLIYGAYFTLRSALESEETRARLSAVYAVVAGLTAPFFLFLMPRLMGGLHPGSKDDAGGNGPVLDFKMSPNMLTLFFIGLIAFNLLFVWMLDIRVRVGMLEDYRTRHKD